MSAPTATASTSTPSAEISRPSIRTTSEPAPSREGRQWKRRPWLPWAMWGLGAGVYAIAVFERNTLGVAGLAATQHFQVGPVALSMFTIVQLLVYAVMQVPVGVLADRFGPRRMLSAGLVLMSVGQLGLALTDQLTLGVVARALVGAGDAMAFISVLRLVASWFPVHRTVLMTQLTSFFGMVGNLSAVIPMGMLLRSTGWTPTFLVNAAVAAVMLLPLLVLLRDGRRRTGRTDTDVPPPSVRDQLTRAWAEPGTRLGTWTHMCTMFSGCVFGMLWGYPYLVEGEGVSPATASALLTVMVVTGAVVSQAVGVVATRWPDVRHRFAGAVVAVTAVCWAVVLGWPGPAPLPLLVVLVLVLGCGGPASMLGFDYARRANPVERSGTASGLVNLGGFSASVVATLVIGLALQVAAPLGAGAYPVAFGLQFILFGVGLFLIGRLAKRTNMPRWQVVPTAVRLTRSARRLATTRGSA